jgi:hypothetical protein
VKDRVRESKRGSRLRDRTRECARAREEDGGGEKRERMKKERKAKREERRREERRDYWKDNDHTPKSLVLVHL